jgi:hypothetical protein
VQLKLGFGFRPFILMKRHETSSSNLVGPDWPRFVEVPISNPNPNHSVQIGLG